MATCFCLQRLPNVPYQHPRLAVMGPHERGHWAFSCHGVEGMNVSDAHAGRLQDLDGHDDELFPACFSRVTCLIAIRGYKAYRLIRNVQRIRDGVPLPVPRHRVVRCIAETMFAFLNQAQPTDDHDDTFTFSFAGIQMEHLCLLELHRYGKTIVPVFGYIPPSVSLAVTPEINPWFDGAFTATFDMGGSRF